MKISVRNSSSHHDAPYTEIRDLIGVQIGHFCAKWPGASRVVEDLIAQNFYINLVDDLPEAPGALGYHSVDERGRPFSKVAVNPSLQHGSDWLTGQYSVVSVAGHETLETIGNPIINIMRDVDNTRSTAQEMCDAVEDVGYHHSGADLTNFLLPSWFNPFGVAPFDYLGELTAPFTMSKGGYMIVRSGGKESAVYGETHPEWRVGAHTRAAAILAAASA